MVVYLAVVLVPVVVQSRYPVPLFPQNLILLAGLVQFHCQFFLDKQPFHFFSAYNIFAVAVFVFVVVFLYLICIVLILSFVLLHGGSYFLLPLKYVLNQ